MAGGDAGKGASRSLYVERTRNVVALTPLARFAVRDAPSPEASLGGTGEPTMHMVSKRARFLPKRGVHIIVGPSLDGTEPRSGLRRPKGSVSAGDTFLPRYDFHSAWHCVFCRVRVVGRSFRMRV